MSLLSRNVTTREAFIDIRDKVAEKWQYSNFIKSIRKCWMIVCSFCIGINFSGVVIGSFFKNADIVMAGSELAFGFGHVGLYLLFILATLSMVSTCSKSMTIPQHIVMMGKWIAVLVGSVIGIKILGTFLGYLAVAFFL